MVLAAYGLGCGSLLGYGGIGLGNLEFLVIIKSSKYKINKE